MCYDKDTMSIKIVRNLPENEWRSFVEEHPAGNIFHTPEMFQVFSMTKGYYPQLWAAVRNEKILAILLPVQVTLMNGPLKYFTTRSIAYGSILSVSNSEGKEALVKLLRTYSKEVGRTPLFTQLRNLSDLGIFQEILRKHGFAYEDYLNYLINIALSPEEIMQNIGRRTRKHIRRELKKKKVSIEPIGRRNQIEVCYALMKKSYGAANVPLADSTLFESAYDVLEPKGLIRFTIASVDESPVAVSVDLLYKKTMYGWYGGLDRSYNSYLPNELLTWYLLKWGSTNGFHTYDFGGAGRPDEKYGVRDFKAKFGGELVFFGRNFCIHRPLLLEVSNLGYKIFRRFF